MALFLLRALQVGLSLDDLERLEFGQALDIMTEAGNDQHTYRQLATQEDFDRF